MKTTYNNVLIAAAAVVIAGGALAPVAHAEVEVSASVGVANMYYWRGLNLGNGDAAVFGDLAVSAGGAYGGIWASSGDAAAGTEYNLYLGYGREMGDFNFDISAWTYAYPETEVDPGELVEIVSSLGFGPVALTYYHGLEDSKDYWYATAEVTFSAFNLKYGLHEDDLAHVDLSYAYNDHLSFTLGLVVNDAETSYTLDGVNYVEAYNNEPKFIVSLSLPIDF